MGQVFTCGHLNVEVELSDISTSDWTGSENQEPNLRWPLLTCTGMSVTFNAPVSLPETYDVQGPQKLRYIPRMTIPFGAMAESEADVVGKYRGTESFKSTVEGKVFDCVSHEIELRYDHTFLYTRTMRAAPKSIGSDDHVIAIRSTTGKWKKRLQ